MKKLLCLFMLSVLVLSGCSKNTAGVPEDTGEEGIVNGATNPGEYTTNDFVLFTLDDNNYPSMAVAALGVDPATVEYNDEKAEEASKGVVMDSGTVPDTTELGEVIERPVINHFSYQGGRIPLTNSKGIVTTGIATTDTDKNCSKADEIIKAYVIDDDNEEYITNKTDDQNYTIDLYFTVANNKGTVERIITPKGENFEEATRKAGYIMRFFIVNGYVHGIDCMML